MVYTAKGTNFTNLDSIATVKFLSFKISSRAKASRMSNKMSIKFLGATGTVTGSCTLITFENDTGKHLFLVDAGVYQDESIPENAYDTIRELAPDIQKIFITHAHLDHIGLIPRLIEWGFKGTVCCTRATKELIYPMLNDALRLEGKASIDIDRILGRINYFVFDGKEDFQWGQKLFPVTKDLKVGLLRSGHILGSCSYYFSWLADDTKDDESKFKVVHFSGDIGPVSEGQSQGLLAKSFAQPYYGPQNRYMVVESTYGNRTREKGNLFEERINRLHNILQEHQNATVVIPAFALNRAQEILFDLSYISKTRLLTTDPFTLEGSQKNNHNVSTMFLSSILKFTDGSKNEDFYRIAKIAQSNLKYTNPDLAQQKISPKSEKPPFGEMDIKTFSAHIRFQDIDKTFAQQLIDIANEMRLKTREFSFNVSIESPLVHFVNQVFRNNLFDSYMTSSNEVKMKYLPNIFFEKFNKFNTESNYELSPIQKDDPARIACEKINYAKKIIGNVLPTYSSKEISSEFKYKKNMRVIVTSSGMCENGKVLEVLPEIVGNPDNCIIITGYQAAKTNGNRLLHLKDMTEQELYNNHLSNVSKIEEDGVRSSIRFAEILCKIEDMSKYYSGHADQDQLVEYVHGTKQSDENRALENKWPTTVFLNHGTDESRIDLKEKIEFKNKEMNHQVDVVLPEFEREYIL